MRDGPVLISTHDLPRAGRLRQAFRGAGYAVDLVTPGEEITDGGDARLLVLTEGAGTDGVRPLLEQARTWKIPVIGYGPTGKGSSVGGGLLEVFPPQATPDEVALVGRRIVERQKLQRLTGIVGETDPMREVLERVVQIAPVPSTVLVTGESGTGKELVARGLHALSPRRHKAFIGVNVAALSDTLLESELFGHEKGAFTGAVDSRKGFFELADRGTIFLDEIGEMPLSTQTKLLRVLEEREFLRVGGERPIKVDVRIITATNQDLRQLVAIGDFRKDLYYRLNVLTIHLPPLRERRDDIPLLVRAFIDEITERYDRPFAGISSEAMEILRDHRWPGNIRELRNLVESMVVLAPGRVIRPADIPPEVRGEARGTALVPGSVPRAVQKVEGDASLRPQLEFIFRTLVDLRVDMDDLRKEFEAYREQVDAAPPARVSRRDELRMPDEDGPVHIVEVTPRQRTFREDIVGARGREVRRGDDGPTQEESGAATAEESGAATAEESGAATAEESRPTTAEESGGGTAEDGVVVFRPGMTMEDLERHAVAAALREVGGNRRKAAELLGIGERTLYRKIGKYGLEEEG